MKKIYVVTYHTEDGYSAVSNYYYKNKKEAIKNAEGFCKDSSIFKKYEIHEIIPSN